MILWAGLKLSFAPRRQRLLFDERSSSTRSLLFKPQSTKALGRFERGDINEDLGLLPLGRCLWNHTCIRLLSCVAVSLSCETGGRLPGNCSFSPSFQRNPRPWIGEVGLIRGLVIVSIAILSMPVSRRQSELRKESCPQNCAPEQFSTKAHVSIYRLSVGSV